MSEPSSYLIDSDVLITAKNRYYSFLICPGFWDSILHGHTQGMLFSIDRVRQELLVGRDDDDLVQWVRTKLPVKFFLVSGGSEIVDEFSKIMLWVTRNPQYQDEAKAKFATGADGWLVAHGVATGRIVVTNEQPRPGARSVIKLPDVCDAFSVKYVDTFSMLHNLGVQFHFDD